MTLPSDALNQALADMVRESYAIALIRAQHIAHLSSEQKDMIERALRSETAASASSKDAARLDFLADITNLGALRDCGAMLSGKQERKIRKTVEALSAGYEVHRRVNNTEAAFRLAVDDAIAAASLPDGNEQSGSGE